MAEAARRSSSHPLLKSSSATTSPPAASNALLGGGREAGAVGVVQHEAGRASWPSSAILGAEHLALEQVGGRGAEVQAGVLVLGEVGRRVRRGELHDTCRGDLVDDREGDARGRRADDRRDVLREEVGHRDGGDVGRGVARVTEDDLHVGAAVCLVDLSSRRAATPASSGGPRNASVPLWGRIVPSLRVRSRSPASMGRASPGSPVGSSDSAGAGHPNCTR